MLFFSFNHETHQCANRASRSCNGAISTNHDISVPLSVKEDSHDPDPVHSSVAKLRHQIKDDSRIKKTKVTQIFADAMLEATYEMCSRAGKPVQQLITNPWKSHPLGLLFPRK